MVCRAYVQRNEHFQRPGRAINAKYQRHWLELEFRNRRRSLAGSAAKAEARVAQAAQQFPVRYFRIDSQPLFSLSTRSVGRPFDEYGYSVHSLPSRAPRPVTLVRSGTPCVQFYCLRRSSVTETRAREEQTATRRGTESGERPDFQMDINSSACSTPRSSLITPLQLLSLIKASGPAGA